MRLFDTHAHFFTNDTARYPVDVTGAREGEDAIRRRIATSPATPERIFALWDACSVTGGAAVQYNSVYKKDNSYCLAVADEHPSRVSAVLMLDASRAATARAFQDLAASHNVCGLRLFGFPDSEGNYPWLNSSAAIECWEVAAQLGLRMVVMYAPGNPSPTALNAVRALAVRFPQLSISLDHFGWTAPSAEPERLSCAALIARSGSADGASRRAHV